MKTFIATKPIDAVIIPLWAIIAYSLMALKARNDNKEITNNRKIKQTSKDHCYYCQRVATSKEHVPPKCLFPEEKDLDDGVNYRKNLITVPSCEYHNTGKCKDDEYLQLILMHGYFNNIAGREHFNKKVVRALTRRPAILAALYANQHPVTVDAQPTVAVDIDRERFNRVLDQVCQGLYFNEFKTHWQDEIEIHTPLLLSMNDPESDRVNELVVNLSKEIIQKLSDCEKKGENQEIL